MKPKLTPWFPGHIKPVRPGVYETTAQAAPCFQFWNGHFWGCFDSRREVSAEFGRVPSDFQGVNWRGLSEPPK